MVSRVKDIVCLTSVSLILDIAVSVIRSVRPNHASSIKTGYNLDTSFPLRQSGVVKG